MPSWWRNTRGEAYVALQGLLMGLVAVAPLLDPTRLPGAAFGYRAAGWMLGLAGAALATAGLVSLGRNLTPLPRPKTGAELVDRGAYRLVRHPIYAGISMAAFGWALGTRSPIALLLAFALLAFFDVKSRREEHWLLEAYPGYAAYRGRVKKLIPFVY
jgi:protein-S-isoprenylcysteine O-methyltransferase Ste14